MVNPIKDYEQNKIHSSTRQTVIIDQTETGETDELNTEFHEAGDPEPQPDSDHLDGEGIDESKAGLNNVPDDAETTSDDEAGLNRSSRDDLSLNIPDDDVL